MDKLKLLLIFGVFALCVGGYSIPDTDDNALHADDDETKLVRRQFLTPTIAHTPPTKCPTGCMHEGKMYYCTHVECHVQCTDAVKLPGNCCPECFNGPNCNKDGHTIQEHQTITLPNGDVVTCVHGGDFETQVFTIVG